MARKKGKKMNRTKRRVKTERVKTTQLTLLNIKVSPSDRRALDAAARKYGKGNLSAWLRYAGMNFKRPLPLR